MRKFWQKKSASQPSPPAIAQDDPAKAIDPSKVTAKSEAMRPPRSPYDAAKAEFNEIWGVFVRSAQNWRAMAIIEGLALVIAVAYVGRAATQSKFIPYIVEIDGHGVPMAVSLADRSTSSKDARLVRAFLTRFIVDYRSVSVDPVAEKAAITRLFSMVAANTPGEARVREWIQKNNPLRRGMTSTVAVDVKPLLNISGETWQASWRETTRSLNGKVTATKDYRGTFTVAFNPPTDEQQVLLNPLGLFVIDTDSQQELGQ